MAAALGCNDDTTTLVHAQARVNEVMTSAALNTDSEVQVSVHARWLLRARPMECGT
jgi:hypothetical protein